MQQDLAAAGIDVGVVGVNGMCCARANEQAVSEVALPWLQETYAEPVWAEWGADYRDVVVLDRHNRVFSVYSLRSNNLLYEENYQALRELFVAADAVP